MRPDPLVIGAVGGSGTRVFARIARHAGLFVGAALNEHEDSQPLVDFYDAWVPLYLKRQGELSVRERQAMEDSFQTAISQHRAGHAAPQGTWGVKNPRSLLMLRFWHERFPAMRFLHVVRHGLDMATSASQREIRMYRYLILDKPERERPLAVQSALYWSRFNLAAAEYGRRILGARYLQVRFEDLCEDPQAAVRRIFAFLAAPMDPARLAAAAAEVRTPSSIGRWRAHPVREVAEAMVLAREGLERFGYWDAEASQELAREAAAPRWRQRLFAWTRMKRLSAYVRAAA